MIFENNDVGERWLNWCVICLLMVWVWYVCVGVVGVLKYGGLFIIRLKWDVMVVLMFL